MSLSDTCCICRPPLINRVLNLLDTPNLGSSEQQLEDYLSGLFPQLGTTLHRLHQHMLVVVPNDIQAILFAFVCLSYDCMDAYQYLEVDPRDHPEVLEVNMRWAMYHCKSHFATVYEATPRHLHGFLDGINFEDTFEFLFKTVLPRTSIYNGPQSPRSQGWLLFRWLFEAATHPDTDGHMVNRQVFECWQDMRVFLGGSINSFRPDCYPESMDFDESDGESEDFEDEDVVVEYAHIDIRQYMQPHTPADEQANTICTICIDDEDQDDLAALTVCGHIYHRGCFESWANIGPSTVRCPLCRKEVCEKEPMVSNSDTARHLIVEIRETMRNVEDGRLARNDFDNVEGDAEGGDTQRDAYSERDELEKESRGACEHP